MAYVKVPPHGCQHDYPASCQHLSSTACCPYASDSKYPEWRCSQGCVTRPQCSKDSQDFINQTTLCEVMKHRGSFAAEGETKCQSSSSSRHYEPSSNHRHSNFNEGARSPGRSENKQHVSSKEGSPAYSRAPNQVLSEIQCHPGDDLAKASQHLKDAAVGLDNNPWMDRPHYQQEIEAVRSQLLSLRNHSAIAFNKQPPESKRMRRESGNALLLPSNVTNAINKRPRDLSPSIPAIQAVWDLCGTDNDSSDIQVDDEYEDEEVQTATDESSDPGSNTPSLVGETLGSISLTDSVPSKTSSCNGLTVSPVTSGTDKPMEPPLRNSMFSYVPPFVRFQVPVEGAQGEESTLPPEVKRLLKWKLSPITPLVVRRTLLKANYRLVKTTNDWAGTWGKHMKSALFTSIKDYQKMNHFPGTFQIGRKDRLWRNLHKLMQKFGKKEFGFMPKTYVLPQDLRLLRQAWEKSCGIEKWIVKPPASARGTGIRVVHKWSQIPKKRPLIVQKYIAQPYLINGSKFDLRLYVFVSSMDPLRIYLYDDGLVRFASVKYSNEMSSLHDRYMHLTNYSINKNSSQYTQNEDAEACQGHKWTVKALWSYLAQQGINVNDLWTRLEDLVVKTIVSGESAIAPLIREHVSSRYCCYELFGVDVLLDEHLNPWLLEVNISPSLHSSSPLDQAVKGPLVCNLLNMAGYHIPNKLPASMQKDFLKNLAPDSKASQLCLDNRLYYVGLSREEAAKQLFFTKEAFNREEYLGQILQNLTADDVRHLIQAEDERTQAGGFIRIFPTPYSHKYHMFFEGPRYYNMLFDAWETRYNSNRAPGISLLEDLCKQKNHLSIPALSARAKSSAKTDTQTETAEESTAQSRLLDSADGKGEEQSSSGAQLNAVSPSSKMVRTLAHHALLKAKKHTFPCWRRTYCFSVLSARCFKATRAKLQKSITKSNSA